MQGGIGARLRTLLDRVLCPGLCDLHRVALADGQAQVFCVRNASGAEVRVLQTGGVWQSATYLGDRRFEPVFAYYRAFDHMFEAARTGGVAVRYALMLGGGGFAYPKHALTTRSDLRMDVVEIDPAIVQTARDYFFLDELEQRLAEEAAAAGEDASRLRVITLDGRAYLEACARAQGPGADGGALGARPAESAAVGDGQGVLAPDRTARYDAIINDTFSGREPVRALATVEAARAAHACLVPGGLYLANVVSRAGGTDVEFLRDVAATLMQVFACVHVITAFDDEAGEDNYLVIATDDEHAGFTDAIAFGPEFLGTPLFDETE